MRSSWPPAPTGSRTRRPPRLPSPLQRRPPMRNPRNEPLGVHDIAEAPGAGDGPERRCVLSGRHGARDEFVRLALSPEGAVLPDAQAKAPGRGAWIGVGKAELADAIESGRLKGALARAF